MDVDYATREEHVFKIGLEHNELVPLVTYLKTGNLNQVGFNNIGFDSQVTQYIINTSAYWIKHLYTGVEINAEIYTYTQKLIDKQNSNAWADYPAWKLTVPQLDLFKIWHFDNLAKLTSLKWVQYMMDWPNLQDMPIHHYEDIVEEQVEEVISYCRNDVMSTLAFFDITLGRTELPLYKGKDKLQLRKNIQKKFGIDCLNYNDVKIGDELNKMSYCKLTGIDKKELRNMKAPLDPFTFGDCIPAYVKYETPELNAFIDGIKPLVLSLTSKQNFPITFKGTKYVIAKGGIHSEDRARILKPTDKQFVIDADISSQYPHSIIKRELYPRHLGPEWLVIYGANKTNRISAKLQFKATKDPSFKSEDELYKLSLNGGGFGKMGEETSWQYDPFGMNKVTIGNQFEILMLIEMLELDNFHVLSANTDGVVTIVDKTRESAYKTICEKWELLIGNNVEGKLEYTYYDTFVQLSVNSYLALKTDDPKYPMTYDERIKTKNDFTVDVEIHKNKSNNIISRALMNYFLHGTNPKVFILAHRNIYDFCGCVRSKGAWFLKEEGMVGGEIINNLLQKTVRYYMSKSGNKIVKHNPDGRKIQTEAGKCRQTIFNQYVDKPWDEYAIDYDYYIDEVYTMINLIQPEVSLHSTQLALFAA